MLAIDKGEHWAASIGQVTTMVERLPLLAYCERLATKMVICSGATMAVLGDGGRDETLHIRPMGLGSIRLGVY